MGKVASLSLLMIISIALTLLPLAYAADAHTAPQLLWKFDTGNGPIFGCPADNDGIIYFTAGNKAFAVDNGSLSWEQGLGALSRSNVYYYDGRVYAGDNEGKVTVLNASDGSIIWTFKTGSSIHAAVQVYDGKVFAASKDRFMYCLDMDGNLLWKFETGDVLRSDPCFYNGNVYFNGEDKYFYALNADTGKLAWKSSIDGQTGPKACEYNGKIYTSSYIGGIYSFDEKTGRLDWSRMREEQTAYGNIQIDKDTLYVATTTGMVNAINPFTGGVYWDVDSAHQLRVNLLVSENEIILTTVDGFIIEMDSGNGDIISRTKVSDSELTGSVLLSDDNTLYFADMKGFLYVYKVTPYQTDNKDPLLYIVVGGLVLVIFSGYIIKRSI